MRLWDIMGFIHIVGLIWILWDHHPSGKNIRPIWNPPSSRDMKRVRKVRAAWGDEVWISLSYFCGSSDLLTPSKWMVLLLNSTNFVAPFWSIGMSFLDPYPKKDVYYVGKQESIPVTSTCSGTSLLDSLPSSNFSHFTWSSTTPKFPKLAMSGWEHHGAK